MMPKAFPSREQICDQTGYRQNTQPWILCCLQWNDVHGAVSRVKLSQWLSRAFPQGGHEVDIMARTLTIKSQARQAGLDKPAGERYNPHTRIAEFQCGYVLFFVSIHFLFVSWIGGAFAN
jgi:hypothetical protein